MKFRGKRRFGRVLPRHWERFAREAGLAPPRVRRDLLAMADRLPAEARSLADELQPASRGSMFDRIVHDVEARGERVRRSYRSS